MKAFFNTHQDLYSQSEPAVYATHLIPEIAVIEANFELIKDELNRVLKEENLKAKAFHKRRYAKSPNWNQIELLVYGLEYPERIQLFPQTYKIISKLKGVSTVYFSFLDAKSKIQPHNGDTDAYYRIHLGIKVPAQLPDCGLEVAGEKLAWQEGKCFAFNDIYYHSAWNNSEENRIVLIIDLLRPEFRQNKMQVESGVIATLILSRMYKYVGIIIELFPRIITRLIHPVFHRIVLTYFNFKKSKK